MRNHFNAREVYGFKAEHCFAQVEPENWEEILEFLNDEAERRGVFDLDEGDLETADYIKEDIWEKHCNQGLGPRWIISNND